MRSLTQVPGVGFAGRALAVQAPLLAPAVLAGASGYAIFSRSANGSVGCDMLSAWCNARPPVRDMALWTTVGALPYTGAVALAVAARGPLWFVDTAPNVLLLSVLFNPLLLAPAASGTGASMLGASDLSKDVALIAFVGGLASFAVSLTLMAGTAMAMRRPRTGPALPSNR